MNSELDKGLLFVHTVIFFVCLVLLPIVETQGGKTVSPKTKATTPKKIGKPGEKPNLQGREESDTDDSDDPELLNLPQLPLSTSRHTSPLPEEIAPWVPFDSDVLKSLPEVTSITQPFNLYVDGVRFVPDNAILVKVTGRVYNLDLGRVGGEKLSAPDIEAYPELDFGRQAPFFNYRVLINEEGKVANPDALALLQVHMLEQHSRAVVVMGSALFGLFDTMLKKPLLKFGGHQLRLHFVRTHPVVKVTRNLTPDVLDEHPIIPGASLLVRILPHTEEFEDAPTYESGYYQSESCRPTPSEWRLFRHYLCSASRMLTLRHIALKLLREERHTVRVNDDELQDWIKDKLANKSTRDTPKWIDFVHFAHYDIDAGVAIQVKKVHFLPEYQDNHYIQVLVRILPGRSSKWQLPTREGWGVDEKFLTRKLNFRSHMRAPAWLDMAQVLHPYYDDFAVVLLELYGVQAVYERDASGLGYGSIHAKEGTELHLSTDNPLAWTVAQIFHKGCVNSGLHVCPLIKGKLSGDMTDMLRVAHAERVVADAIRTDALQLHEGSSIEIELRDGNFVDGEAPPLPKSMVMMEKCGLADSYLKGYTLPHSARKLSSLMSSAFRETKPRTRSEAFKAEKELFEELMWTKFTGLMNTALMREGLKPLQQ